MTALNPYLNFNGNCEEAFTFYKKIFKSEFANFMRFSDVPAGTPMDGCVEGEPGNDDANLIMHVALPIGNNVLMGSDVPGHMPAAITGNNITLSLSPESKEEADRLFAELSEGGKVIMPMDTMFWGDYFGMVADKFGINWMINFSTQHQPQQ
ncbi:VOC family protein [Flavobacterium rhizosphaerae]|uniref:VOC family protein n=1 Tax=Flavobacterium rhizosphaerae TaxID=3163298 RepID=A0ABW8YUE7_9FLAO